ncbi:MAG: hypothetical protein JXR70_02960 [Spirochaetales bacterium]|nr:hypothetical protein [Spirochaetales bacterium]
MSIQYYIKTNNLNKGDKYYAKTQYTQNVYDIDLLNYMVKKNTAMSITELKAVIDLLKQSITELMKEGSRVILENLITFFPVVKAGFKATDEAFHHASGKVKVKSIVSRGLSNEIRKTAIVEKMSVNKSVPTLNDVVSGIDRKNEIRWPYSTSIIGKNLKPFEYKVDLLRIINKDNPAEELIIHAGNLILDSKSDKEITFSISQNLSVPQWLEPGKPVLLQLEYRNGKSILPLVSNGIETYWLNQIETLEVSDSENTDANTMVTE